MLDVKQIQAIGFDVDQTLYRTSKEMEGWILEQMVLLVSQHAGIGMEEASRLYRERYAILRSNTQTLESFGLNGQEIFQQMFDELPLERYVSVDEKLLLMLQNLKKKYSLFIISNGTKRHVMRKLKMLGIENVGFDPIVCCYDHPGWNKPNPASFLYALEKLALIPEECVYVGDREETDILAAQAVGMQAIKVRLPVSKAAQASCEEVYDIEKLLMY